MSLTRANNMCSLTQELEAVDPQGTELPRFAMVDSELLSQCADVASGRIGQPHNKAYSAVNSIRR